MATLPIKGNLRSWGKGTAKAIVVPGIIAQSCGFEAQEYEMTVEDWRKNLGKVSIHILVDVGRPNKATKKPVSDRSEG